VAGRPLLKRGIKKSGGKTAASIAPLIVGQGGRVNAKTPPLTSCDMLPSGALASDEKVQAVLHVGTQNALCELRPEAGFLTGLSRSWNFPRERRSRVALPFSRNGESTVMRAGEFNRAPAVLSASIAIDMH
jgi:hypothetical protein